MHMTASRPTSAARRAGIASGAQDEETKGAFMGDYLLEPTVAIPLRPQKVGNVEKCPHEQYGDRMVSVQPLYVDLVSSILSVLAGYPHSMTI